MAKEIRVPFGFDRTGGIGVTTDPDEQVRQHVEALLHTSPGERVIKVGFGVSLVDFLFENLTPGELAEMQQRISDGMDTWVPSVRLVELSGITGPNGDVSQGTATLTLNYIRRYEANPTITSVDIPIATV